MFKKLIFCSAALALFASCNEDFDDWASPQTNEQEEMQTVSASSNIDNLTFDLNSVEDDSLQVVDLTIDAPDGYLLSQYVAQILFSVEGEEGEEPSLSSYDIAVSNSGKVAKADLQNIITSFYGKRPDARNAELCVFAKLFTSAVGSTVVNTNKVNVPMTVTPEATPIASAYYLVGDMLAWNADGMQQFSHSDKDVYDDPVFTIVFTTTADNQYWKIIPQTNIDNDDFWANPGVIGTAVDGDTSFEGNLINVDAQAAKIETAGKYRMTINMLDFTYKIEAINFDDFVYFIGATDGWTNSEQRLALQNNEGLYTGYVYCADPNGWGNQFKFQRVAGSWDNEINSATFSSITGDFGLVEGNTNIEAKAGEAVYYVELNLGELTLNAVKVETMGIIGDFNGWGGDVAMSWNAKDYCFEATGVGATAAGWKFRLNSDWALNLGGEAGNLYQDGSNLWIDANTVKLYPTRKDNDNIYCVVE
ncbi:MAG: DUF5115 domain-containing protein [Bacteroidaceae bacterium]|nr:DUF5115 domain-containing protein [Bacteroidaceae bacterium]